jgi:hypothetical protein
MCGRTDLDQPCLAPADIDAELAREGASRSGTGDALEVERFEESWTPPFQRSQSGPAFTTHRSIATSIHRRWNDRAALIREAALSAVDAAAPVSDTGNVRSDLIAILNDVRELLCSPLETVLLDAARYRDDALDELRQTNWRARLDQCAAIVERAVARGELPSGTDHRLVFDLLIGPIRARTLLSPDTRRRRQDGQDR